MSLHLKLALLASLLLALGACGGGTDQPLGQDGGVDTIDAVDVPDPETTTDLDTQDPKDELDGEVDVELNGECNKHEDCVGGYCIEFPPGGGSNICVIPCPEECPEGSSCKLVYIDGGSPVSVCIPNGALPQCTICNKDAECVYAGARCVKGNAPYGYCVSPCSGEADTSCGTGHDCRPAPTELSDGLYYCQPKAQSCCVNGAVANCDDDNPCTEEYCGPALGCLHRPQEGECTGSDPCMAYSCLEGQCLGWPITDDPTFNGVDDDCDGSTDEDVWRQLKILHHNYGSGASWMTGPGMKLWGVVNAPGYHGVIKDLNSGLMLRPGMPLNP